MRATRAVLAALEESLELRLKSSVKTVGIKPGIRDNQIEDRARNDNRQDRIPAHEIRGGLNDESLSGDAGKRDCDLSVGKGLGLRQLPTRPGGAPCQNKIGS